MQARGMQRRGMSQRGDAPEELYMQALSELLKSRLDTWKIYEILQLLIHGMHT